MRLSLSIGFSFDGWGRSGNATAASLASGDAVFNGTCPDVPNVSPWPALVQPCEGPRATQAKAPAAASPVSIVVSGELCFMVEVEKGGRRVDSVDTKALL